jgi:hypothetical protein
VTPWQQVGLCANGAVPRSPVDRASYFATFAQVQATDTIIFVEPGVSDVAVAAVRDDLSGARAGAEKRLGIEASPPWIYLYASVETLRAHACVNSSSIGYYDGAIHLAVTSPDVSYGKLNQTLRHEYVHHVLIRNGIELPTWFQEGTALLVAGELSWLNWHPAGPMLSSSEMVRAFPETASPDQTQALYGQAFRMVTFLNYLCWHRNARPTTALADQNCHFARDLVAALKSGRATPDTLFDWAIAERGTDLFATTPLPLWDDYVQHGFSFSPATEAARLRR